MGNIKRKNSYPIDYLTALLIDTIGSGLWTPFVLLYFTQQRKIGLIEAGNALSLGALCALIGGSLIAGAFVDKVGSFHASTLCSVMRGIIFPAYIFCENFFSMFLVAAIINFGDRIFWAAHGGMVEAIGKTQKNHVNLFALISALRSIGLGSGALLASIGVFFGGTNPLFWNGVILLNAVSYLIAGGLFWRLRELDEKANSPEKTLLTYRDVFSQKKFLIFVCAAGILALVSIAFDYILPIYLYSLNFPKWISSTAFLEACLCILLFSPLVAKIGHKVQGLGLLSIDACLLIISYSLFAVTSQIGSKNIQLLLIIIGVLLFSFAETIFGTIAINIVLSFAPAGQTGRHSAVYQLSWGIASSVGPGLFAGLFSIAPTIPWYFLILLLIPAVLILLYLYYSGEIRATA